MEITHLNCQSFSVRAGRERRESVGTEYGKKTISEFATIRVQTTGFKYCGYSAYVYTAENCWTRTDFFDIHRVTDILASASSIPEYGDPRHVVSHLGETQYPSGFLQS